MKVFRHRVLIVPTGLCKCMGCQECRSGKIDVRNKHQRLSSLRSWVRFPVRSIPHGIGRATLSDSVGFLLGLRFPPTLHYKSPNIVYRANSVLVDAQLYLFNILKMCMYRPRCMYKKNGLFGPSKCVLCCNYVLFL
jgi:hypothetical protein